MPETKLPTVGIITLDGEASQAQRDSLMGQRGAVAEYTTVNDCLKYDFVVFVRPNDLFLPDSFINRIELLERAGAFVVYSPIMAHDENLASLGEIPRGIIYDKDLLDHAFTEAGLTFAGCFIPLCSLMVPSYWLSKCKGWESKIIDSDWSFIRYIAPGVDGEGASFLRKPCMSVLNGSWTVPTLEDHLSALREYSKDLDGTVESHHLNIAVDICSYLAKKNMRDTVTKIFDAPEHPIIDTLVMIRDEETIIDRCIRSVCKMGTDAISVLDTGSDTDPEKPIYDVICDIAKGGSAHITYEFHRATWSGDFAEMRNHLFKMREPIPGGWLYLTDADETAEFKIEDLYPLMGRPDVFAIALPMVMEDGKVFPKVCLIRDIPGWSYKYAYHENLMLWGERVHAHLAGNLDAPITGPHLIHHNDGARSAIDKNAYAEARCGELWRETNDPRYLFFGADAQFNQQKWEEAACNYQNYLDEAENKSVDEVPLGLRYYAGLQWGRCETQLENPIVAYRAFSDAIKICPGRAEALGELALSCLRSGNFGMCRAYAMAAATLGPVKPEESQYIEPWWRAWKAEDLLVAALLNLDMIDQAMQFATGLSRNEQAPSDVRKRCANLVAGIQKKG